MGFGALGPGSTAGSPGPAQAPLRLAQGAAARQIAVQEPPAGRTRAIRAEPGVRYVLRFDPARAQATVEGQNLILAFPSGARIVFRGLGVVAAGADPPVFVIAGVEVSADIVFNQARALSELTDDSVAAAPSGPSTGGGYRLPPPPEHEVRTPRAESRQPSAARPPPSQEQEPAARPPQQQQQQHQQQQQTTRPAPQARPPAPAPRVLMPRRAEPRMARPPPARQVAPAAPAPQAEAPRAPQAQAQRARPPAANGAPPAANPAIRIEPNIRLEPPREAPAAVRNGPGAPDPGEPVYTVEVDDKLSAKPLVLAHDRPTRVRFAIGPRAEGSVIPAIPAGPELEAMAAGQPLTLTVTLDCLICRVGTYARAEIVYDPAQRRSDAAVFEIRPSRAAVLGTRGYGLLVFTVDARGLDLAVIKIPSFVDAVPPGLAAAEIPAVSFVRPDVAGAIGPDLVVDIGSGAGKLPIGLNPVNPELRARMHEALRGQPWPAAFESGVTVADLSDIVADTYKALRGIVEQNEAAIQTVYGAQGADTELSPAAARLRFDDRDKLVALGQMRRFGTFLYRRAFVEGEPGLRRALKALDDYALVAGRPLRVRIRATDVYAPWQMLYSAPRGEPAAAEGFWGFRYEMGTLQKVNAAQAPARTFLPALRADDILLGAWRGDDEVGQRAGFLRARLAARMGGDIPTAHSRADFLAAMRGASRTVKLIVFYGHASSGTVAQPNEALIASALSLPPTLATDWTGERLMFAEDDHLVPLQIDELIPDDVFDDETNPVFFKEHPIVILNACETGTGGTEPMNNNGFIGRLTMAGAGAVFVTEAPVWRNFAYQFGNDLLDEIAAGHTMQAALHAARIKHLQMQNNPLGLLYSLYGNPALRVGG